MCWNLGTKRSRELVNIIRAKDCISSKGKYFDEIFDLKSLYCIHVRSLHLIIVNSNSIIQIKFIICSKSFFISSENHYNSFFSLTNEKKYLVEFRFKISKVWIIASAQNVYFSTNLHRKLWVRKSHFFVLNSIKF